MTQPDRIAQWLRDVATARAETAVDVPGGVVVRHSRFPLAHDHNRMVMWEGDADSAAASVDGVLGGAGLEHRLIDVQSETVGERIAGRLQALGYSRSDELVMTYDAPEAPVPTPPGAPIKDLDLGQRIAAATAGWQLEQPDWLPDVSRQLGERISTLPDVVDASFLAVVDGPDVVSRADLYLRDGVAQVEEVFTAPAARGRGYGSRLVLEGVRRARRGGAEVIFLIVDLDGPIELYRRLGFADGFVMVSFSR